MMLMMMSIVSQGFSVFYVFVHFYVFPVLFVARFKKSGTNKKIIFVISKGEGWGEGKMRMRRKLLNIFRYLWNISSITLRSFSEIPFIRTFKFVLTKSMVGIPIRWTSTPGCDNV